MKAIDKAIKLCDSIYKFTTVNDVDGINLSDTIKKAVKNYVDNVNITFDGKNKYTVNANPKDKNKFMLSIENFGFFDKWL